MKRIEYFGTPRKITSVPLIPLSKKIRLISSNSQARL
jgi:hypothetical protein